MRKLTSQDRQNLPADKFGLPKERKYPMTDKTHARLAIARADQQYKAGKLSAADRSKVCGKAKHILDRS